MSFRIKIAALALAFAGGVATPAMAMLMPFASFDPVTVRYVASSKTFGTTTSATGGFGSVATTFNFLQKRVNNKQDISALLTFTGTTNQAAMQAGGFDMLSGFTGTFSIISTQAFTTTFGKTYAAGTNLLSITLPAFTGADFAGGDGGSIAGLGASTLQGDSVAFTSAVLDFSQTVRRDFSLSMVSVTPTLSVSNAGRTTANLRSFRATANGIFSSDPMPMYGEPLPEPATWAMMIVGFGAIGGMVRASRRRGNPLAA